ncbi:MAG: FtsQ-type POTRA domain-containing protein [bacterium]
MRVLISLTIFSVLFYGISTDSFTLRAVRASSDGNLPSEKIVSMAGLDDAGDIWAIFIPREKIRSSLLKNPLIESARISLAGPRSLKIAVTQRKPFAALEKNGFDMVFDRTGELIEIRRSKNFTGTVITGAPTGLLKSNGTALCELSPNCAIPVRGSCDREFFDLQFKRIIHLGNLLGRYNFGKETPPLSLNLDRQGKITVEYENRPPIKLGLFDRPNDQFKRLVAVLNEDEICDRNKVAEINLSSLVFPYLILASGTNDFKHASAGISDSQSDDGSQSGAETVSSDRWSEIKKKAFELPENLRIFKLADREKAERDFRIFKLGERKETDE